MIYKKGLWSLPTLVLLSIVLDLWMNYLKLWLRIWSLIFKNLYYFDDGEMALCSKDFIRLYNKVMS